MLSSVTVRILLLLVLGEFRVVSADQLQPNHRYSFNNPAGNASGAFVLDTNGGANGTVVGAGATFDGEPLLLPGGSSSTQAYVDLPNGLISGLLNVSMEAWVTIDGVISWGRVFDFGTGSLGELNGPGGAAIGTDYFAFMPTRSADLDTQRIDIWSQESGNDSFDTDLTQTLGVQYHFVVTFRNTGGAGEVALYRDGVQVLSPLATPVTLNEIEDVNNWLGRSNWTGDQNFQGRFNEFRIYSVALTAEQVAESYNAGPDSHFGDDLLFSDGFEN